MVDPRPAIAEMLKRARASGLLPPALAVAAVIVGVIAFRVLLAPGSPPVTPPASAPVQPAPAGVPSETAAAAAPHPAVTAEPPPPPPPPPTPSPAILSDNPPPTETSARTVIEDEPLPPPGPNEPPTPKPAPRMHVSVDALPAPGETAAQPATASTPVAVEPASASGPAWRRYALATPPTGGKPIIAVIIDDVGLDRRRSKEVIDLPGPLTLSFMSYAGDMPSQEADARAHAHEIMMHVPMEPIDQHIDPGPGVLLTRLSPDELRGRLIDDLGHFDGYVGINNHMGSKFTAYPEGMRVVMEVLKPRGLLFIDSVTTDKSVGLLEARRAGVPTAARNVFLDAALVSDVDQVAGQLRVLEDVARKKGNAIAIGHPRDGTIAALAAWLPTLPSKGLVLVPVTAVVRARMQDDP